MHPRFHLLLTLGLLLGLGAPARAQYAAWHKSPAAGTGDALATDAAGNSYLLGYFCGYAVFDTITLQAGGHIFNYGCGGGAMFLAKVSAAGRWQWARPLPLPLFPTQVALDTSGHVFLAGFFTDTVTVDSTTFISRGRSDVFVGQLSAATGAWQWLRTVGGSSNEYLTSLAVTPAGAATVAGAYTSDSLAFGATVLTDPLVGPAGRSLFVARLAVGGTWLGAVSAQSATTDTGWDNNFPLGAHLALDAAGNAYLTGAGGDSAARFGAFTVPVGSSYVARLSAANAWQWAQPVSAALTALTTGGGSVLVAGSFFDYTLTLGATTLVHSAYDSANPYVPNGFVAMLDPLTGAWGWATGTGQAEIRALATDLAGDVYLTGQLTGPATLGTTTLVGPTEFNDTRLFVASLTATGAARWAVADTVTYAGSSGNGLGLDAAGNVYVGGTEGYHAFSPGPSGAALVARVAHVGVLAVAPPGRHATFVLYPNPATGKVRLSGAPAGPVSLTDALGRTVRTTLLPAGQTEATLDLAGLPAGLYLMRSGAQTRRLVVE